MKDKPALRRIRTKHVHGILAVISAFLVTLGILVYWVGGDRAERVVVEREEERLLTLADSGALSITDFFKEARAELLLLSRVESVTKGEEGRGREAMELVLKHLYDRGPLAGLARVDSRGVVMWAANVENDRSSEGISVADRSYFLWAVDQSDQDEVFISEPLIGRGGIYKGEWGVVLAAPVFNQGEFAGLVFLSLPLNQLTEKYVLPLASLPETQAFLVSEDGVIVASTVSEEAGKSIYDCVGEDPEEREVCLRMIEDSLAGGKGSAIHYHGDSGSPRKGAKMVTAYSPIEVDGMTWSLWISTPYKEAAHFVSPLHSFQSAVLVFVLGAFVVLILTFVFGIRVAQKDGFVKGFIDGRDGAKSRTAKK